MSGNHHRPGVEEFRASLRQGGFVRSFEFQRLDHKEGTESAWILHRYLRKTSEHFGSVKGGSHRLSEKAKGGVEREASEGGVKRSRTWMIGTKCRAF